MQGGIIHKYVRDFLDNLTYVHNTVECGTINRGDTMRYNEKTKAYTMKYALDNLKRVPLDIKKTEYEAVKAHATARGEKVNGFIKRAIRETMERDKEEQ